MTPRASHAIATLIALAAMSTAADARNLQLPGHTGTENGLVVAASTVLPRPKPVLPPSGSGTRLSPPVPLQKPTARGSAETIDTASAKPSRAAVSTRTSEPPPPKNAAPAKVAPLASSVGRNSADRVTPIKGGMKAALDALSKGRIKRAIGIRNGMKASLGRQVVDWQLARSGAGGIPSAFITRFARQNPNWPDNRLLRIRAETALLRENPPPSKALALFNGSTPISISGSVVLARANMKIGRKAEARKLIRGVWHTKRLSASLQSAILREFGTLLNRRDHWRRASAMLYRERVNDALRLSKRLTKDQQALMNARVAVIRRKKNAGRLLKAVPKSVRGDPSYTFARVQHLRRAKNWSGAAKLLVSAPHDANVLINPDEWWVERRLVSRKILELGKARTAYRIAANHSARAPAKYAEAEFHAGWYALRFVKDPTLARPHFKRILAVGKSHITRSRGHYWLGRADEARGNKSAARQHFQRAAQHGSAFYGQLARAKLGKKRVGVARAPKPGKADRTAFDRNELVRALKAMAAAGHINRTLPLFLHLSKTLPNPAQASLLINLAERYGKHRYALIAGKRAARRWPDAAALAFPLKAIPRKTKIKRGVEKPMVYAIARQESAFDPGAISHAGARGLLQLMPATARATARRNGLPYSKSRLTKDPAYNATLGAAHLGELVEDFNGSYIMTFAGYNAGPRRVSEWVARFGDPRSRKVDAIDWIERIPFTETRNYVQRITENLQVYRSRLNGSGLKIDKDLRRGRPG